MVRKRSGGSQTSLGKFGFAKVRLRQCSGSIVYIPLPLCIQQAQPCLVVVARRLWHYFAFALGPSVRLQGEAMKIVSRVAKVFSFQSQSALNAPGLYKARPRLVVVARRLRRYFAFARGPKGVRLQGEVMKTVSRVAKVFSRGRNHMKHLVEANLQSRTFWAKRWTRPSIHVLVQHLSALSIFAAFYYDIFGKNLKDHICGEPCSSWSSEGCALRHCAVNLAEGSASGFWLGGTKVLCFSRRARLTHQAFTNQGQTEWVCIVARMV